MSGENQIVKRKPGRPSNRPTVPHIPINGIVAQSSKVGAIFEMVSSNTDAFKKIFTCLKNMKAVDIFIRCQHDSFIIFTRDSTHLCKCIAYIKGEKINHYYCERDLILSFQRRTLEVPFNAIDASIHKISFVFSDETKDYILIVLTNLILSKECQYKINTSNLDVDIELMDSILLIHQNLKEIYPLQFVLLDRDLKKSIADASSNSNILTIQKNILHPVMMTYSNPTIKYSEIYTVPEKIHLIAPDDKNFRCTICLQCIKPFSASVLTNKINVYCSETQDLLLKADIHTNEITFYVFVKLKPLVE